MNGPARQPGAPGGAGLPPVEELEIELLLEALFQRFGFDFRAYERGALSAKLRTLAAGRELASLSLLQDRVLHDAQAAADMLRALSVPARQLFDDVPQALVLRTVLESALRASAMPRVWLAECGGAEQAWTLAILLAELGLDQRTEIFATVANEGMLADVADASIASDRLALCNESYVQAGGRGDLLAYFEIVDGRAMLLPQLRERITWAQYNLVTDASFNEFQLIVCQRALADFGPSLRARTLRLFHESLALFGVLGLDRELDATDPLGACYQPVVTGQPWYKRIA